MLDAGETRAVPKSAGSEVFSGTLNVGQASLEVGAAVYHLMYSPMHT